MGTMQVSQLDLFQLLDQNHDGRLQLREVGILGPGVGTAGVGRVGDEECPGLSFWWPDHLSCSALAPGIRCHLISAWACPGPGSPSFPGKFPAALGSPRDSRKIPLGPMAFIATVPRCCALHVWIPGCHGWGPHGTHGGWGGSSKMARSLHAPYTQASLRGLGRVWSPLPIQSAPLSLVFPGDPVPMPWPGLPIACWLFRPRPWLPSPHLGYVSGTQACPFTVSSNQSTVLPLEATVPAGLIVPMALRALDCLPGLLTRCCQTLLSLQLRKPRLILCPRPCPSSETLAP